MELDLAPVGSCSGRRWSASDAARICERCDAAEEKTTSCRFPWLYARGNERVTVTPIGETSDLPWRNKAIVEWPREQRREDDNVKREEAVEIMNGDIESCLRLATRRGFFVDVAAPARTADEVVRRRIVPRVVGADQPAEVCCAPVPAALAA